MGKVKQRAAWLATIFCQLLGVALVIGGRGFAPIASAQDYPNWGCTDSANPCTTCPETLWVWQCVINLQGWSWGMCTVPLRPSCYQSSSSCGDDCDCQNPPNETGQGRCGSVFDTCTNN